MSNVLLPTLPPTFPSPITTHYLVWKLDLSFLSTFETCLKNRLKKSCPKSLSCLVPPSPPVIKILDWSSLVILYVVWNLVLKSCLVQPHSWLQQEWTCHCCPFWVLSEKAELSGRPPLQVTKKTDLSFLSILKSCPKKLSEKAKLSSLPPPHAHTPNHIHILPFMWVDVFSVGVKSAGDLRGERVIFYLKDKFAFVF